MANWYGHGGRRKGAGRPPGKETFSVMVTLPLELKEQVRSLPRGTISRLVAAMLAKYFQEQDQQDQP